MLHSLQQAVQSFLILYAVLAQRHSLTHFLFQSFAKTINQGESLTQLHLSQCADKLLLRLSCQLCLFIECFDMLGKYIHFFKLFLNSNELNSLCVSITQ